MEHLDMKRFSYVSCPRKTPFQYDTVINVFLQNTERMPNKEIFIQHDFDGTRKSITNKELKEKSFQLAKFLISMGMKKGDHVALFGPNTIEWVIGELAIIIAGGTVVHVAPTMTKASDMQDIFGKTDCKTILIDPGTGDKLVEVIFRLETFVRQQNLTAQDSDSCRPGVVFLKQMQGRQSYISFLSEMNNDVDFPTLYPEDKIVIFMTSGSTGKPKMAAHTHYDFLNSDTFSPQQDEDLSQSIVYNDRPFGWSGGSPFMYLCRGETRVFTDTSVGLFGNATERIWEIIKTENCLHALLMPYFLSDLIKIKDEYRDNFKLKSILTGGQIIDNYCMQTVGIYAESLVIKYGSSEAWFVTMKQPMRHDDRLDTGDIGQVIPGVELKVIDADENITKRGISGEICIRSGHLFHGYYLNEEATKAAFLPGKWYRTGDRGLIKDDDSIVVQGRMKDIISRGIRKIAPEDVENIILQMDGILYAVVIAVPDKRLYEDVCACFVAKNGYQITEKDVRDYCHSRMLGKETFDGLGEIPSYYLKFDTFPCQFTGKPDKQNIKITAFQRLYLET